MLVQMKRREMTGLAPAPGSAGPADRGAGCGAAGSGGRRTPDRGPATRRTSSTVPSGQPPGRYGDTATWAPPCRSRRARRRPRCRPAPPHAGDPPAPTRSPSPRRRRRGPCPRRSTRRRRAARSRPAAAAPSRTPAAGRQRPPQQLHRAGAGVVTPAAGRRPAGLGPAQAATCGRPARAPGRCRPRRVRPVHLHVGGVDVDGHRPSASSAARGGSRHAISRSPAPGRPAPRQAGPWRRQPGGGRGGRPGTGVTAAGVGAQPVQPTRKSAEGGVRDQMQDDQQHERDRLAEVQGRRRSPQDGRGVAQVRVHVVARTLRGAGQQGAGVR